MATVAETIAGALRRHEVDSVFGQSLPTLVMLAADRVGIRQVVYRTENAGGAVADAYARSSGRVGVVAAQNGPAAALLAEALHASIPVVALVQDIPRGARTRNGFQELDHQALFAGIWVPAYLRARRPGQRFLAPHGLAGLGWGPPMNLGAQVARPGARVVCVTGDGGFAHSWAERETAVRERLPVTTIVLDNGMLGYQKHAELHQFGAHTSAIPINPVDHTMIARACGAEAVRVADPEALAPACTRALATDVPTLVEVAAEPDAVPPITQWDDSSTPDVVAVG